MAELRWKTGNQAIARWLKGRSQEMTTERDVSAIGRLLHELVVRQDPDARNAVYLEYRDRLCAEVRAKARANEGRIPDEDLIHDAVSEAIIQYLVKPESFKPQMRSLVGYLGMSAWKDYLNLVDKRKRRPQTGVGIDEEFWNKIPDDAQSIEDEVATEDDEASELVRKLKDQCVKSAEDQIIYGLLIDRVRETDNCLQALGWEPGNENTERLRNAKERIIKCLRRAHSRFVKEDR
jgi:hypothetical protein